MDIATVRRQVLDNQAGTMTFAPRFSPDGNTVVFSLEQGGNTDIYTLNLRTGQRTRLTNAPSIETAPSFSPDGSKIVFESDRSGVAADIHHVGHRRRRDTDQLRRRQVQHAGVVAARRPDRLHQAERGPLSHRRDADRRQRGTAAHGFVS